MKPWFDLIPEDEMIDWRRHIHENPELSFKEYNTSDFVEEKLKSFGNIEIQRPTKTSVLGILKGDNAGKTILLRADMDALPMQEELDLPFKSKVDGVAHTCGHDTHTAMLLASAKVLSKLKGDIYGTVKFIFQHAEELNPGGAREIVASGLIDDVDAVVGLHIMTNLKTGSINIHLDGAATTAADGFFLDIIGKGSHGSMPQNGIDPIIIGVQIINQLQTIVSRDVTPGELAVISIGEFKSGDAPNIIPEKAYMSASVRTITEETRAMTKNKIKSIIDGICKIHGATYNLNYVDSYPAVINDKQLSQLVFDSAKEALGEEFVNEISISSASEDFAYYRKIAPICFMQLGGGLAEDGFGFANHNPKFNIDEDSFLNGVKAEVQSVLNFLKE